MPVDTFCPSADYSCDKEIESKCATVTPGAGRVKLCLRHNLRKHEASFRASCREAIKHKDAHNQGHHRQHHHHHRRHHGGNHGRHHFRLHGGRYHHGNNHGNNHGNHHGNNRGHHGNHHGEKHHNNWHGQHLNEGHKTHFIQDFISHENSAPHRHAAEVPKLLTRANDRAEVELAESQATVSVQGKHFQIHVALLVAGAGLALAALLVMVARRVQKRWRRQSMERSQRKAQLLAKTVEASFPASL